MGWFEEAGNGQVVDVAMLMDSGAPEVIWRIVTDGALVSIGRTSDGGALGITVTLDGQWRREYFRDVDDLVDWLARAAAAVAEEAPKVAASSARRQRVRRP